jgi:hypothetical protein
MLLVDVPFVSGKCAVVAEKSSSKQTPRGRRRQKGVAKSYSVLES